MGFKTFDIKLSHFPMFLYSYICMYLLFMERKRNSLVCIWKKNLLLDVSCKRLSSWTTHMHWYLQLVRVMLGALSSHKQDRTNERTSQSEMGGHENINERKFSCFRCFSLSCRFDILLSLTMFCLSEGCHLNHCFEQTCARVHKVLEKLVHGSRVKRIRSYHEVIKVMTRMQRVGRRKMW